jgi:hypothetical protein
MGTVQVVFEEEQPEVTEVTCPEVTRSHVTGRGHVRKCVLRMLNRKLRTICPSGAFFTGSDKDTWPEDVLPGLTIFSHTSSPPYFFPIFFSPYFFPVFFSPVLFSLYFSRIVFPYFFSYFFGVFFSLNFFPIFVFFVLFFPYFFSPVFFSPYYFRVLFQKSRILKSNVSKYQWVVFSSTCRYNTVHVPCGISIQTSPVGLPLDGWGTRMRDLKGPLWIYLT